MNELVVIGTTCRDYVDGGPARPGGAPLYAAPILARLNAEATIVTRCSRADRWLAEAVSAAGLPVVWNACSATPTFSHTNRARERESRIEALAEPWSANDLLASLPKRSNATRWIQVGALWRGEFDQATLSALTAHGRICLDGQGLVRPGRTGPVVLDSQFDRAILQRLHALHVSLAELIALGLETAADSLDSLGVPEVIVTLGERGSVVWANGRAEAVPAERIPGADPTGAGDAFTAAYLASRGAGGEPVDAARAAAAAVSDLLRKQIS